MMSGSELLNSRTSISPSAYSVKIQGKVGVILEWWFPLLDSDLNYLVSFFLIKSPWAPSLEISISVDLR